MPSKKKKYNSRFPPARIKKIMQTDEDIGKVAAAVPVLISKCLEMFLVSLLSQSGDVTRSRKAKTMSTSHIKQCILEEQKFDFLKELVESIPDVQNEEEGGINEEDQKKIFRKRSMPRPKKEAKKRARIGGSTEESDSSEEHEQTSEDNQNLLLSPPTASTNNAAESSSGSMQFHIPIDNIIAASKFLSDSSTSEAEVDAKKSNEAQSLTGSSKTPETSEPKPEQHRQGVIVKNIGVAPSKPMEKELNSQASYTPMTVPLHLSPQLPNPEGPIVQPGGMLNFLYSGLAATPPPQLPVSTAAPQSYMYNPLTQAKTTSTNESIKQQPLPAPPYFSFPSHSQYQVQPSNASQVAHSSGQRHYLGYPQAILTPSQATTNNNHDIVKPIVQPAKRKSEDEDDDYDE